MWSIFLHQGVICHCPFLLDLFNRSNGCGISVTAKPASKPIVTGNTAHILDGIIDKLVRQIFEHMKAIPKSEIVNCLIRQVEVYRDYKLHIDFNIDFTQFSMGLDIVEIAA